MSRGKCEKKEKLHSFSILNETANKPKLRTQIIIKQFNQRNGIHRETVMKHVLRYKITTLSKRFLRSNHLGNIVRVLKDDT